MALIKYRANASETWTELLGVVGPQGPVGPKGPKPEKGVDYMTETDIYEIARVVLEIIASGEEIEY